MPVIEHDTIIAAGREEVFALVSRVEEFAAYSDAIDTIERLNERRYLWWVRVAGVPLRFDVEITELVSPEHFSWRSMGGVTAQGGFRLTPVANGTHIHMVLEYRLASRTLEKLIHLAASPLLHRLSHDIVDKLEARLEARPSLG